MHPKATVPGKLSIIDGRPWFKPRRRDLRHLKTATLLRILGVPRRVYHPNGKELFWAQRRISYGQLCDAIERVYKAQMRICHPDAGGGRQGQQRAALLSQVISILRQRFERHGLRI